MKVFAPITPACALLVHLSHSSLIHLFISTLYALHISPSYLCIVASKVHRKLQKALNGNESSMTKRPSYNNLGLWWQWKIKNRLLQMKQCFWASRYLIYCFLLFWTSLQLWIFIFLSTFSFYYIYPSFTERHSEYKYYRHLPICRFFYHALLY